MPKPIEMTVGDPSEAMPPFVADKLVEADQLVRSYPKIRGSDELREAIAAWIGRRYGLAGADRSAREMLPVNGSREGLFFAALPAVGRKQLQAAAGDAAAPIRSTRPISAGPTAGLRAGLPQRHRGDRPPARSRCAGGARRDILRRTAAFYLCSPANPQGAVASADYIRRGAGARARVRLHAVLRRVLLGDLHGGEPPTGGLQVAAATPERFKNLDRLQLAVQALEPARACGRASPPATAISSRRWPRSAI